jgi:Flp pilus assembly protein TadG
VRRTHNQARTPRRQGRSLLTLLRHTEASQLMEFALGVPFLVVLLIGILDFGAAYHAKQKLTNAAREGARIAIQQNPIDLTSTSCSTTGASSPCTVEAVRNAVVNYLNGANLDTSFIPTNPDAAPAGTFLWVYRSTATGNPVLTIDRGVVVTGPAGIAVSTRVTLDYPHNWIFDQVVRLLVPSASFASNLTISTEVVMKNLV